MGKSTGEYFDDVTAGVSGLAGAMQQFGVSLAEAGRLMQELLLESELLNLVDDPSAAPERWVLDDDGEIVDLS